MSQKKDIRRQVKAVWAKVKALRSERAKVYDPASIKAAAAELEAHAGALRALADELSALSPMPPNDEPRKRKRKTKPEAQ